MLYKNILINIILNIIINYINYEACKIFIKLINFYVIVNIKMNMSTMSKIN